MADRPAPPSGHPPPVRVELPSGEALDLAALAAEVCARYEAEYPDEQERYGEAGHLWCLHDNQHLLNWAAWDLSGHVDLDEQVSWLAGVLEARDFPLDRLARDLDICSEVVADDALAARLTEAAAGVRARP